MATLKTLAASLAVSAIALSGAASAKQYDWDSHDSKESKIVSHNKKGQYIDTFGFDLGVTSDLQTTLTSDKGKIFGWLSLFAGSPADGMKDTLIDSPIAFDGSASVETLASFSNLLAGHYYYKVESELGAKKLGYSLLSKVTPALPPVPEPETYAMLLAGLGVVGIAARRRVK